MSFNQPKYYKKDWAVFPDMVYKNIDNVACSDTIFSKCLENISLNKCIDICNDEKDPHNLCDAGYYIETPLRSLCLPLRTTPYYHINPAHTMVDKNTIHEFKDAKTYTYMNTKLYPFPPRDVNTIYYYDKVSLLSVKNDKTLNTNQNQPVIMDDSQDIVEIIPPQSWGMERYRKVLSGDEFGIKIPSANLVLQVEYNSQFFKWKTVFLKALDRLNNYKIIGLKNRKRVKDGTPLNYGDKFYITHQGVNIMTVDSQGRLKLDYTDLGNAKRTYYQFKFIPQKEVKYCEERECKTVLLKDTKQNGEFATYKGSPVFIDRCFGMCKRSKERDTLSGYFTKESKKNIVLIVVLSSVGLVLIVGAILLIVHKRK